VGAAEEAEPAPLVSQPSTLPDYSAFYTANEAIAREIDRLLRTGALDRLADLLREGGVRLELEAFHPQLKQTEFLGPIEGGEGEGEETFDYQDFMASRVTQRISSPSGEPVEVTMPDHICPACGWDEDNFIVEIKKTCSACAFQW
jgi:hypothetical protein